MVAGVVGTVANSVIVAAVTPNEFIPLAVSPGRNAVAIAVAALLPVTYARTSSVAAAIIGVAALTVIPSVLAKLVFGVGAPWYFVLGVNAVYAVAAWAVYLAIARTGAAVHLAEHDHADDSMADAPPGERRRRLKQHEHTTEQRE